MHSLPAELRLELEVNVSQEGTATQSFVGKLAKFFPDAVPVHIPVCVSGRTDGSTISENTVIEYGTPREVLFACKLPLEFAAKIRVRNSDGSLDADAWVAAIQYHEGSVAVAARFARNVANWIVNTDSECQAPLPPFAAQVRRT